MARSETTTCAVSGGGPAGIMLGLLLARAGVDTVVLEKHTDFLRDFRGDTVHPSTLELLDELALAREFERLPHRKLRQAAFDTIDTRLIRLDLSTLPPPYQYVAMIPQWDFLTLLTDRAGGYPTFTLRMGAEATGLLRDGDAVRGLRYRDSDGEHELRAALTVAADGRDSTLRAAAELRPVPLGAPMDVLWLRVPREPGDGTGIAGRIGERSMLAAIDRGDYWQIAYLIPKDTYPEVRAAGMERLRASLRALFPEVGDRVDTLTEWDRIAFLRVGLDRLTRWHRPGLLCIGDAAHTMSPIGGVGINLAIQDAVAAANLLHRPLRDRQRAPVPAPLESARLVSVQRRRWWPTVGTQTLQRFAQRGIIERALTSGGGPPTALLGNPAFRRIMPRVMMRGLLPEHVRSPELERAGG